MLRERPSRKGKLEDVGDRGRISETMSLNSQERRKDSALDLGRSLFGAIGEKAGLWPQEQIGR